MCGTTVSVKGSCHGTLLWRSQVQRRDVLDFLALHGAALGVPVLQDHFPALARRDLGCLLHLARTEVDHIAAGATTAASPGLARDGSGRWTTPNRLRPSRATIASC